MKAFITLLFAFASVHAFAAEPLLDEHLEHLRPFLGTWRGVFQNSTPEKPMIDIARWERALNGKAIRVLHSVNEGFYGGETLIYWDAARKTVAYNYFTTAGFQTAGTSTLEKNKIVNLEKVTGSESGTTEVRSTVQLVSPEKFVVKATYLKGAAETGGREVHYTRDDSAQVRFK